MSHRESALVVRICHDLITPFNAINLGIEAFDASGDRLLLNEIKASVDKANAVLKFMRELYSIKSDSFCYSLVSLTHLVSAFLKKYNISFVLTSDFDSIPHIAAKIVMYNSLLAKDIMPLGGDVNVKIDDEVGEIVTVCSGKNLSVPNLNVEEELNYRNVLRISLLRLLEEAKFKVIAYQNDSKLIIREQML
ncbi:MAG: hypothetical protein LBS14_01085 [Holosporaceae bacterium]|jgi:hypothetical protein|nr:hypothetical protein [Holosporaceae bacterium]